MDNYVIWRHVEVDDECVLGRLKGMEDQYKLRNGTPLLSESPDKLVYHMHEDYPGTVMIDNLLDPKMLVVASPRLTDWIAQRKLPHVELLRISIVDLEGKVASDAYHIIHPTHPVDCVDREKSKFSMDDLDEESFESFKRLVLDESRIPEDRLFFRLKGFWDLTLVHRRLAEELDREGFSGLGWLELSQYPTK